MDFFTEPLNFTMSRDEAATLHGALEDWLLSARRTLSKMDPQLDDGYEGLLESLVESEGLLERLADFSGM